MKNHSSLLFVDLISLFFFFFIQLMTLRSHLNESFLSLLRVFSTSSFIFLLFIHSQRKESQSVALRTQSET